MLKRKSSGDVIFDTVNVALLILFALLCLYPLVFCLSMSLSGDDAIIQNTVWLLPKGFSLESYMLVMQYPPILRAYLNTIIYTVAYTFFQVAGTLLLGYVLSKKKFFLHGFLHKYILITMLFSGGMIPSFILINKLGLFNSLWAIILPGAVSVWNALIVRTFFQSTIPDSLLESATIDGCTEFGLFFKIVLPLSKAVIAIIALYAAVAMWNDYFSSLLYFTDVSKFPLQLVMKEILNVQASTTGLNSIMTDAYAIQGNLVNSQRIKYVIIIISTVPIFVIYPFMQKYFVKGVMLGSIKG